nr:AMP-binding protein [Hyphomonas sp. Mor2]
MAGKYDAGLGKVQANHMPLTPNAFVRYAATAYPDDDAIVQDDRTQSWADTFQRCLKIGAALKDAGVTKDSTVSILCRNTFESVELTYAIPFSGGVINALNTRLDGAGIAFILDHGECEILFVDVALADLAEAALSLCEVKPRIILIPDPQFEGEVSLQGEDYETFIAPATPLHQDDIYPDDEWDAIALNYTSGTTGDPKGVVFHHRGVYLVSFGQAHEWSLPRHPRYLWALPIFHANGWCFPWILASKAGTNVCLRAPVASDIVDALIKEDITHLCGAPIVLNMAVTELENRGTKLPRTVHLMTAGSAPPAIVLKRAEAVGFDVLHVYGLTELSGPVTSCAWRQEWDDLSDADRAIKRARQGINYAVMEEMSVRDAETLEETPFDGETVGEVMFRGNTVMKGYLKNPATTEASFKGGRFWSGDLAVRHPDGHIEIRDRSKDIIISGGENISSIEVEAIIYEHPAVAEAAIVGGKHEKWEETPVACVELKPGASLNEAELIAFCRERLAHYKCPTKAIFMDLPKTATGKIKKFDLRKMVNP